MFSGAKPLLGGTLCPCRQSGEKCNIEEEKDEWENIGLMEEATST
jgi:hypothetical protein